MRETEMNLRATENNRPFTRFPVFEKSKNHLCNISKHAHEYTAKSTIGHHFCSCLFPQECM